MRRNGWHRDICLEVLGRKLLRQWRRQEGLSPKKYDIRVFLSVKRKHLSGICYSSVSRVQWKPYVRNFVDGIIILPSNELYVDTPAFDALFKHELLHVLLPGHKHDLLFKSWARSVGAA